MANNLSASFEEIWAREQQEVFYKTNVGVKIADMSFNSSMRSGDTLNRPYRSSTEVQVYTRGTDITIDDLTDTNEQLVVDKQYANGFYVDEFDRIQDKYDAALAYGKDNWVKLSNQVDADILGEVFNATSTVDDGSIGGTSGNGIALSTTNILKVFGAAKKALRFQNVPLDGAYGVISPEFEDILVQYGIGRDTSMGDGVFTNGKIGTANGFELYVSNNTAGSAVLGLATNPSNNDPITIEGVTFTFVSSIGTTAGNVLIGANVDATRANLATLINAPTVTTSTGVALSTQNARKFQACVTAVNDNTANTLTLKYKGVGTLTVSEALTDGTDTWTATKIKQHCLFGIKGNPVCVMQRTPSVMRKEEPKKLGANYLNGVLYGVKTFSDNAKQMVNVEILVA